jgi:hypothetical protein
MNMTCENRAGSLGYDPVGVDKIKRKASKQFLNCQDLKQTEKGYKCIPESIFFEIGQDTTLVGKAFPAWKKVAVSGHPHAVEDRFGSGSSCMGGQNMDLEMFCQTPT